MREYPLPPNDPTVKAWQQPGEVMYATLGVIDWEQYLQTIGESDRVGSVRRALRTLIPTTQRLIVVDEPRWQKTSLPLRPIEKVALLEGTNGPVRTLGVGVRPDWFSHRRGARPLGRVGTRLPQ